MSQEGRAAGELAFAIAEHARRCVGPDGTVIRVPKEDATILRTAFITRLAEAAMKILDQEEKENGSH